MHCTSKRYPTWFLRTYKENSSCKYVFEVDLTKILYWEVDKEKKKLVSFGFMEEDVLLEFHAEHDDLKKLKHLLRNKVMYRDISDFYVPTQLLGKGSSSKVYLIHERLEKSNSSAAKCIDKKYLLEDGNFDGLNSVFIIY